VCVCGHVLEDYNFYKHSHYETLVKFCGTGKKYVVLTISKTVIM